MFGRRIVEAYRRTAKPKDIFWNRFVARPLAAVLLVPLEATRVTPNQITLLSFAVFIGSAAILALMPGHRGLLLAVAVLQLSYVLDCVDGQLARLRGVSTPVGAFLDFMMDELKAFLLVTGTAVRLWRHDHQALWLLEGLGALCAVASAITLTTFMRRPEYAAATGVSVRAGAGDYGEGFKQQAVPSAPLSLVGRLAAFGEGIARFLVHYPSYLVYVALVNRLDLFLHAYLTINAAYVARSLLTITMRLGRGAR